MLNVGLTCGANLSVDAPLAGPSARTQHNTMLDHTPKAHGYSLFKVKGTLLLQLLVASCVLHGVSAADPSPPTRQARQAQAQAPAQLLRDL